MTLTEIGRRYGTDKAKRHNFTPFYERYLEPVRGVVTRVLEVGVQRGPSLRMWRDYFPNATCYGVDIDPRAMIAGEDRIVTVLGDQSTPAGVAAFAAEIGGDFDLVIDDGSHLHGHQMVTLGGLFPLVRPGGHFVLEDLHTSFMAGDWGLPAGHPDTPYFSIESLAKTGRLASPFLSAEQARYVEEHTAACEVYVHRHRARHATSVLVKQA
jgi:SAM-dependent methyltransferase